MVWLMAPCQTLCESFYTVSIVPKFLAYGYSGLKEGSRGRINIFHSYVTIQSGCLKVLFNRVAD